MDKDKTAQLSRHVKIFDLLRQEQASARPAERTRAAAARYLDEMTADVMIGRATQSLKMENAARPAAGSFRVTRLATRLLGRRPL